MHLLIDELKNDGVLEKAMFAVYLTFTTSQSKIQFGGYDKSLVEASIREDQDGQITSSTSSDGIFWMDINSDNHWQVRIYDGMIGNTSLSISVNNAIFDTGSSLIYLPSREFTQFMNEV
mmetsp:Transcript_14305/g.24345  ORF Transcript_14305/g.24345 Transcript_14305/m.24345 type:complete len:119 (+) Transcript_14305:677-1033(+)